MRKDAVFTLLLNVQLFPGMRCNLAQDPRYVRFGVIENGKAMTYNVRVSKSPALPCYPLRFLHCSSGG